MFQKSHYLETNSPIMLYIRFHRGSCCRKCRIYINFPHICIASGTIANVFRSLGTRGCVSTGRDGRGNTSIFPVSRRGQRKGRRVLTPSATPQRQVRWDVMAVSGALTIHFKPLASKTMSTSPFTVTFSELTIITCPKP